MKTSFLLPNRFKNIGWILFTIGLFIWISTQIGLLNANLERPIKVLVLTCSFFSFLFGLYFITFSKEPIEDEYIANIRLKSFQLSAIIQMLYFVIAFSSMFILHLEPNGDNGLSTFFLLSVIIYWLTYLLTFNITILKNKIKSNA
jgi:hypothetical protein